MWVLDAFWLIDIILKFITVRPNIESCETIEIVSDYIQSEFIFDIVATLPTIYLRHSVNSLILRMFHLLELGRAQFISQKLASVIYSSSPILQNSLTQVINFILLVCLISHLSVCLWIYFGDKNPLDDNLPPWLIKNTQFEGKETY